MSWRFLKTLSYKFLNFQKFFLRSKDPALNYVELVCCRTSATSSSSGCQCTCHFQTRRHDPGNSIPSFYNGEMIPLQEISERSDMQPGLHTNILLLSITIITELFRWKFWIWFAAVSFIQCLHKPTSRIDHLNYCLFPSSLSLWQATICVPHKVSQKYKHWSFKYFSFEYNIQPYTCKNVTVLPDCCMNLWCGTLRWLVFSEEKKTPLPSKLEQTDDMAYMHNGDIWT
jgi:hypothetical protein